jgi:hypothetical protein
MLPRSASGEDDAGPDPRGHPKGLAREDRQTPRRDLLVLEPEPGLLLMRRFEDPKTSRDLLLQRFLG